MRKPTTIACALAAFALAACSAGADSGGGTRPAAQGGASSPAASGPGCESVDLSRPPAQPTTLRIGHGAAAEEPFWLLALDDTLAQNKNRWYRFDLKPFRATGERLTAYQAGELDGVVISPQAQIRGTARGALDLYAIATIMREAEPDAFSTSFIAKEGSGVTGVEQLKGKKIGIIDPGTQLDFLARQGVAKGGGQPERDAQYVVLPFPSQGEALQGGQIDVAGLAEPFYTLAKSKGGVVDVFDASDVTDFSYDLLTLSFKREFVDKNLGAICAFAADYRKSMAYWKNSKQEARGKLLGTPFVQLPPPVYAQVKDYGRPADGTVDTEGMRKMTDLMIQFKILEERDRVDVNTLVRRGVSIGH